MPSPSGAFWHRPSPLRTGKIALHCFERTATHYTRPSPATTVSHMLLNSPSQLMHFFWLAPVSDGANQTGKWVIAGKMTVKAATDGDGRCWTVPDGDELDLDYLERRENRPARPLSIVETSPDSIDLVKVILLGAPRVGKTSLIQQFVWNDFPYHYETTEKKQTYYPSVIINNHMYELKIFDLPAIPYFPVNSFYEWTDFRFYGLRSATAYMLVFDLNETDSFQYVSKMRDQITESRDESEVLFVVVGNKEDLARHKRDNEVLKTRDAISTLVRRHWMSRYVECSAKHNWRVTEVFKQLMEMIDEAQMNGRLFAAAEYEALKANEIEEAGGGGAGGGGAGGSGGASGSGAGRDKPRHRCSIL
ncbi:ras-like protein family member 10B [Nilaparvata lugens]|uniref:ras-like protein family member 10B n=1 Tax=Nilaparvata lugens TaxID=108931 RepID=UPI00193D6DFA|nr:ras-like protein family member 10B [Nilaparvata lugens]